MKEQRRLAAIVSADVVGYSRMMGVDESGTLAALKAVRRDVVDPKIDAHDGRIVKTTGDGLLLEFPSVVDAVRCMIEVQAAMATRSTDVPEDRRIVFRIGVNLGDIIIDGDDIFGDGVNVAARLQEMAPVGGVCVSSRVHDEVRDRLDARFEDIGELQLKNIARPVRVWRLAAVATSAAVTPVATPAIAFPDKPSIAVLPFDNMSGDPEQAYFADGIAEDLLTALSRVSWLFVVARNSSFALRGEKLDIRTIGSKLGVRYLVEGSVRKAGSRVRITAQLIEAATGNHLWADKYDGALDHIFDLQDQITESVVGAIEPKLRVTEIARSRLKRPDSLDAFDLLLQALPHVSNMTGDDMARAIDLLDRAVVLSPRYAQALAYGALCRAHRPFHGWSPAPDKDFSEASALIRRALDSDPEDPVALMSAALVAVLVERDYQAGWDFVDRSLAINPNSARAWGDRGWISLWAGEPDAAITAFDRAMRLSPFDQWISSYSLGKAFALNTSNRFEEGLRWARKAMQENPNWNASYRQLVGALALNGQYDEARAVAAKQLALDPAFSVKRWVETGPFRRTPNQERFFEALRQGGLPA
jgi:TolB-like protein/class 3 adenylate cyclase